MFELLTPEKILKKIGVLILGIVVIIYVSKQLINLVEATVETEIALAVTTEETVETECYIMRNEIILNGGGTGIMLATVGDGERISKDREAVKVYYRESDYSVESSIREIDKKIDILEKSSIDTAYVSADIEKMDDEINELFFDMIVYNSQNDLIGALSRKDDILVKMNKRWLISNPNSGYKEKINALYAERLTLKSKLTGNSTSITAPESGYYYGTVDGYENIFSASKINGLTIEEFEKMRDTEPEIFQNNAGKIVTDYKWYIACPMGFEEASKFNIDENYNVEFTYSYGTSLQMTLYSKISGKEQDNEILIFCAYTMPEDFEYTRNQKVKIVYKKYSGLKISKDALRVLDGIKGVYVVNGTEIEFKRAEEIYSFDDYYIIDSNPNSEKYSVKYERKTQGLNNGKNNNSNKLYYRSLSLYDKVVVKGRDIYDGMQIE